MQIPSSIIVLALVGCGDNLERPDAPAGIDMAADDMAVDAGPCGAGRFVTGELVDLDSSNTNFKGINNARLTVQGSSEPAETDTTSPNGRFELCVPTATGPVVFDLVADADASPRYHDGFVYLDDDSIANEEEHLIALRAFDQVRRAPFYITERAIPGGYDPTKAHVLVWRGGEIGGDIDLDRPHETPQQADPDANGVLAWSNGKGGRYVLFPNVDVSQPTGVISGELGTNPITPTPHTIPLAADKLTLVGLYQIIIF